MSVNLGIVMDPIAGINVKKDTTLAMMLAAQERGWTLSYMEQKDLYIDQGTAYARVRPATVRDDPRDWYTLGERSTIELASLDAVLMRKDPPFDMEFVYTTYILERAEAAGCLIVNKPQSLRDANEKMYTSWFSQCCPPTMVTRERDLILDFVEQHQEAIIKPLDGMGGASIFRMTAGHPNTNVTIETLTAHGARYAMIQKYIPEIRNGDKRVLLVDGEPVPYALARVPSSDDARGNLAAGATGEGRPLTDRDRWIAEQVGPVVREKGLLFVGLDVIGDYLTEVNVTSPTCVRELQTQFDVDIAGQLMDVIAKKLAAR